MHHQYAFIVFVILDLAAAILTEDLQQIDLTIEGTNSEEVPVFADGITIHVGPVG
jgi:hypothetical protein